MSEFTVEQRLAMLQAEIQASPHAKKHGGLVDGADTRLSPEEIREAAWFVIKVGPSGKLKLAGEEYEKGEVIELDGSDSDVRLIKQGFVATLQSHSDKSDNMDLRKFRDDVLSPLVQKFNQAKVSLARSEKAYQEAAIALDSAEHTVILYRDNLATLEGEITVQLDEMDEGTEEAVVEDKVVEVIEEQPVLG